MYPDHEYEFSRFPTWLFLFLITIHLLAWWIADTGIQLGLIWILAVLVMSYLGFIAFPLGLVAIIREFRGGSRILAGWLVIPTLLEAGGVAFMVHLFFTVH